MACHEQKSKHKNFALPILPGLEKFKIQNLKSKIWYYSPF
ncbi:hypothetical protein GXM_05765 [Nostoc sphaeroides CCNUC1]|uniref:Uncharacterized protein n=1 Tax=Nostoc sphaeroides CCNUC1 TaxID=2653204 RepID=A0A5P8W680_9NOSO|nr:hypothetical protein GXM_05765 [Nostoc sphaeroides CCNUC1]